MTEATTKFRGTVKCWFGSKGYGFIKRDSDGTDHFAHISEVPDQFDDLKYGQRVDVLQQVFEGMGYTGKDALIRARVFYWHQVGYYAVGMHEAVSEREANLAAYIRVLAGDKYRGKLAR